MDFELLAVLFTLGLIGGFLSGLLGIGGGIIMVPLLLYIPPAFGLAVLSMKAVAGITSLQSFVGAISGVYGHKRYNRVNLSLAWSMGGAMAAGSLFGSVWSKQISSEVMLMVFASMALIACALMFLPKREENRDLEAQELSYNKPLSISLGAGIGLLSGVIGQGGAFLFIPAMLYVLHVPTRIAIGTALAIGVASSLAVLLGRIGTSQVPYLIAIVLVCGVLIGAQIGSIFSQRTPRKALRSILAVVIAGTSIKIWYELLVTS